MVAPARPAAHRPRDVVALRPRIVDRREPELGAVALDHDALVAQDADPTSPEHRDERLALGAEVVVIAHRHEDALLGAQGADDIGHVFVEVGAAGHHIARDHREVRGATVGRARPGEAPGSGRERPDVQVRELGDAQPFEPRVEPGHAHVVLRHPVPAASHEDAVTRDREPRKVRDHVRGHRQTDRAPSSEFDRGHDERRHDGRDQRPQAGAPVDEVRDVDEADDGQVPTPSIGHAGAGPPDEEQHPREGPRSADHARRRPSEPPPQLGDAEPDGYVHDRRDAEEDAEKPPDPAVPDPGGLRGARLDVLCGGRSGQTPSSLTSVSLLVTPT